jgi:hypothetical protein
MTMKTLLGFIALVLYTFSMLGWGHVDAAKLCRAVAPAVQLAPLRCPTAAGARDASVPASK